MSQVHLTFSRVLIQMEIRVAQLREYLGAVFRGVLHYLCLVSVFALLQQPGIQKME